MLCLPMPVWLWQVWVSSIKRWNYRRDLYLMLEVPNQASQAGGRPSNCPVDWLNPTCQLCLTFVGVPISLMTSSSVGSLLFDFFVPLPKNLANFDMAAVIVCYLKIKNLCSIHSVRYSVTRIGFNNLSHRPLPLIEGVMFVIIWTSQILWYLCRRTWYADKVIKYDNSVR